MVFRGITITAHVVLKKTNRCLKLLAAQPVPSFNKKKQEAEWDLKSMSYIVIKCHFEMEKVSEEVMCAFFDLV